MQPTKHIRNQHTPTQNTNTTRKKLHKTTTIPNSITNGHKQHTSRPKQNQGATGIMLVQISDKEQRRIQPAKQYYTELGCDVEVTNLQYGDYIFDQQVAFEYKTIPDFINSITDHRAFNESINQAENYNWHYLLIQGNEAERTKQLAISKHHQPITIFQYLGSIASINRYSTVIECYSPYLKEAFYRMYIQARKDLSNKPIVKKFPKKHKNTALNFLTYSIYGINYKKAKAITDQYNLHSLNDLMKLTIEDLTLIEGIGENTATKIIGAIHGS